MAAPQTVMELVSLASTADIVIAILNIAGLFVSLYVLTRGARMILKIVHGDNYGSTFVDTHSDSYWQDEYSKQSQENLDWNGIKNWREFRDMCS